MDFLSNIQNLFNTASTSDFKLALNNSYNPNLINFNSFEISRMWLVKKYFLANQLKNNTSELTATSTVMSSNKPGNTNEDFTFFLEVYNQSLPSQTDLTSKYLNNLIQLNTKLSQHKLDNIYLCGPDFNLLKVNGLSFVNKFTCSASNKKFKYYNPENISNHLPINTLLLFKGTKK